MGSSYGGPIAARIAIDHPEAFYQVLLLAAAIDPATMKNSGGLTSMCTMAR